MEKEKKYARLSIDVSLEQRKKLKCIAALKEKSIREIVLEAIRRYLEELKLD